MASRGRSGRSIQTVLFTDIVGSTRRASRLGDKKWRELLDRHDDIVRQELARHSGSEVKTVGDGFLATFRDPEKGVLCARALGERLAEVGLRIRAGLHTGRCEHRKGDLGGIAVHIAARISELAEPGEVLVSETVKDLVTGSKLPFASRGTHVLRGVPEKWRLYRLKDGKKTTTKSPRAGVAKRTNETTLMIVDDHPLFRASLRQVLEHKKAATIVGEASSGAEALTVARRTKPDVILMDMDLPQVDGIEATKELLRESPDAKILFLSALDTREKVLEAVAAGAKGYLIKTASPDEIASAVRRVNAGEAVFTPSLANVVLDEFRRLSRGEGTTRPGRNVGSLTKREQDVLGLMAEGRSNRAIGAGLHLSPKTVEAHVASIFSKLGLQEAPDDHRRVLAVVEYLRSV